jgi:hypothetical protein
MFRKETFAIRGLAFIAIALASLLASAQQHSFKCNLNAVASCGPTFSSPDCAGGALCNNTDPTFTPHHYCYPQPTGPLCDGFICVGVCGGIACKNVSNTRCP